jgi:hypothetical protein
MRYFWWAEFQKRGAIHYHMILVDSPFRDEPEAKRWLTSHWTDAQGNKLADIQAWTQYRSADWFKRAGGDYILKDVRKLNGKRYEQEYTRMPRGWRTFRCHQLTFTAREHQEHESKAHTVCVAPAEAPWHEKIEQIYVDRVDRHVPHPDGCRLTQRKVRQKKATVRRPSGLCVAQHNQETKVRDRTAAPHPWYLRPGPQEACLNPGEYSTGSVERAFARQKEPRPHLQRAAVLKTPTRSAVTGQEVSLA